MTTIRTDGPGRWLRSAWNVWLAATRPTLRCFKPWQLLTLETNVESSRQDFDEQDMPTVGNNETAGGGAGSSAGPSSAPSASLPRKTTFFVASGRSTLASRSRAEHAGASTGTAAAAAAAAAASAAIQPQPLKSSLKDMLKAKWQAKQEEAKRVFEETGGLEEDDGLRKRIMALREESAALATVRKDRVFDSEVTEEEERIIQRRVELQRLQFLEFEQREHSRKLARVRHMFSYLTRDEASEAVKVSHGDEEQAIINFTAFDFLIRIRKAIAERCSVTHKPRERTLEEENAYNRLLEKRRKAANKTTSEDVKKKSIKYARLKLDDALDQLKMGEDPNKVFEGWSEARIRSYKQIHTKPNSYYYRFNAPGEKQGHGPWTLEEKALFFARLKEVGADGQWGIFSMAIPGRVGYQCSNFYRHLLKTNEIQDPNYVIDEKGELHYLFGKKGGGTGVIRVHSKHGSGSVGQQAYEQRRQRAAALNAAVTQSPQAEASTASGMRRVVPNAGTAQLEDGLSMASSNSGSPPPAPESVASADRSRRSESGFPMDDDAAERDALPGLALARVSSVKSEPPSSGSAASGDTPLANSVATAPAAVPAAEKPRPRPRPRAPPKPKAPADAADPAGVPEPKPAARRSRKKTVAAEASVETPADEQMAETGTATESAPPETAQQPPARKPAARKRAAKPSAAVIAAMGALATDSDFAAPAAGTPTDTLAGPPSASAGAAAAVAPIASAGGAAAKRKRRRGARRNDYDEDDDDDDENGDEDDSGTFTLTVSRWAARRARIKLGDSHNGNEGGSGSASGTGNGEAGGGHDSYGYGDHDLLTSREIALANENPLPGFTDPITLEEVIKPAISPYGHVMGYDSWIRCLTADERKNVCPITKNPLSKRELVILTPDNIEEYWDRIVNK